MAPIRSKYAPNGKRRMAWYDNVPWKIDGVLKKRTMNVYLVQWTHREAGQALVSWIVEPDLIHCRDIIKAHRPSKDIGIQCDLAYDPIDPYYKPTPPPSASSSSSSSEVQVWVDANMRDLLDALPPLIGQDVLLAEPMDEAQAGDFIASIEVTPLSPPAV